MANVVATSSIQFTDMFDATPVQSYIASSGMMYQTYDKAHKTYNPDYTKAPLTLTFTVLKAGSTEVITTGLGQVTWVVEKSGISTIVTESMSGFKMSGKSNEILTISENIPSDLYGFNIRALATFVDEGHGSTVAQLSNQVSITLSNYSETPMSLNVYSDTGFIFMNGAPSAVRINADVYEEGAKSKNLRSFSWFRQDTSVTSTNHPLYDERVGLGWAKIDNSSKSAQVNSGFDVGTDVQGVLTVTEDDVINIETYQVIVTMFAGPRSGDTERMLQTVYSYDNPISVIIHSSAGTLFKNGEGSTDLTALLYKSTGEVDHDGTAYTYKWYYYKSTGELDPSFGDNGNAYRKGKTITVPATIVPTSANFVVEVSV